MDVLRARQMSTGVTETWFSLGQLSCVPFSCLSGCWQILSIHPPQNTHVRRRGSGREEWIHCFKGATSIIFYTALGEFDQPLLEESKTVRSPALSHCATSADNFFHTTEPDRWIARPLWECYQLVVVPPPVNHPLPGDQGLQEQTSQSVSSAPLPPLCHVDCPFACRCKSHWINTFRSALLVPIPSKPRNKYCGASCKWIVFERLHTLHKCPLRRATVPMQVNSFSWILSIY